MKILYHHRTASRDGQAVHIDEMVHALRSLGHEVLVVGPQLHSVHGGAQSSAMGRDVSWVQRLRAFLPKAAYELLELAYSLPAWWRLRRAARVFQPDLIYERYNLHMLAGMWVAHQQGRPYFVEVNAPLAHERGRFGGLGLPRMARWSERLVWCSAQRVFTVTRVLADHVVAQGVPHDRVVVTPNGINADHFKSAPTPEVAKREQGWQDALVLGFTGFVREWHGVDRVIRWMAGPTAPARCRLLVVGDGPARASLEDLAQQLQVQDRVRFTGVVDRDAVPALVASFDIALQPAVVDYASPLKLFEYLALGKAVLAPSQANIQEVLSHDRNAVLFAPADEHAFTNGLHALAHDAELRQRLGQAARRTIDEQGLTWLHNARRVVAEVPRASLSTTESVELLP